MILLRSWHVHPAVSMVVGRYVSTDVNLDHVRHIYEALPRLNQPLDLRIDEENHIPLYTEYRPIEKNMSNTFSLKW